MKQSRTTSSTKRHSFSRSKLSGRLRMVAALIALPIGLVSLLPKSAFATAPPLRLNVQHGTVVVAQPYGPRSHHGQERAAAQREVIRYEEARRAAQRKRWCQVLGSGTQPEQ